jgi:hypothetical protein
LPPFHFSFNFFHSWKQQERMREIGQGRAFFWARRASGRSEAENLDESPALRTIASGKNGKLICPVSDFLFQNQILRGATSEAGTDPPQGAVGGVAPRRISAVNHDAGAGTCRHNYNVLQSFTRDATLQPRVQIRVQASP